MAVPGTRDLIFNLREQAQYDYLSCQDESEHLAESIEFEYDSSYDVLSSRSSYGSSDISRSHGPAGILVAQL